MGNRAVHAAAVACVVGVALVGPQAVGVAAAEETESGSPTAGSASTRVSRGAADPGSAVTGPRAKRRAPAQSAGRGAGLPVAPESRLPLAAAERVDPGRAGGQGGLIAAADSAVQAVPGGDPSAPSGDPAAPAAPAATPLGWTLLAAARREFAPPPAVASAGAGLFANPVIVAPAVSQFADGIINGSVRASDANGLSLFYSVAAKPGQGGKVTLNGDTGRFAYLPDLTLLNSGGAEQFSVLVSEKTALLAAVEALIPLADLRTVVRGVVAGLQQIPIVNLLLAPLIGRGVLQQITIDNAALVPSPDDTPVAYTTKIASFDGTLISTNYFPAAGLQPGQTAPAVFTTAGLSSPGQTDPYAEWDSSIVFVNLVPGVAPLREAGYNVITWDSRGKADSGGVLELGAPEFEGRDFTAIVDYYATRGAITSDGSGDPLMGTVGGSYGGGMQLVNATLDSRIDAIVPGIAWNTLSNSLYPERTFNTVWGALLPVLLLNAGDRVNPQVYLAALTGVLFGTVSDFSEELLARTGPGELAAEITAPALLIQGIPDTTFPLEEAVINAELISGAGTPVKMIWYCGGHGVCLNPQNPGQDDLILDATLGWLDRHVRDDVDAQPIPTFQWVDQFGDFYAADLMPFEEGFNGAPLTATGAGGVMPILSVLGGGGPSLTALPLSLLATGSALNAVNVTATATGAVQIVGSPRLTFSYSGLGTASHLFAQIVDDQTGLVLSNGVTPIPVTLDGRTHTVNVDLADVAHTLAPGNSVTLQLTNAGLPFYDFWSLGAVGLSDILLELPTVADRVAVALRTEVA